MIILMNDFKDLLITKKKPIYKYETSVDNIKILIPQIYNEINMRDLQCVVQCLLPNNKEGLYKYCNYNIELYKERLCVEVPITTSLSKEEGCILLWLLFIKRNEENESLADYVLKTNNCIIVVNDSKSPDSLTESSFDEVWQHTTESTLIETVNVLSEQVHSKADNLVISDGNIYLMSDDTVIDSDAIPSGVIWKEWV